MIYQVILTEGKRLQDINLWSLVPNLSIGDGFEIYNMTSGDVHFALLIGGDEFVISSLDGSVPKTASSDTPEKAYDRAMGVVR